MDIIFSEKHKLRDAQTELYGGQLVYSNERPSRMEYILKRLTETGFGQIHALDDFGINLIRAIHNEDFIQFLKNAWTDFLRKALKARLLHRTGLQSACLKSALITSKESLSIML
mgnify:CR=1 FL=1